MERTERLFEILGDIDDDLIASAAPDLSRIPKKAAPKRLLPLAACLLLAVLLGAGAWRITMTLTPPTVPDPDEPPTTQTEETSRRFAAAVVVGGDDDSSLMGALPILSTTASRYRTFTADEITYTCLHPRAQIDPAMVEQPLGEGRIVQSDNDILLTYYRLSVIPSTCAVAVRFEGEEVCCVYVNEGYRAATLGELCKELNLLEFLQFDSVSLTAAVDEMLHTVTFSALDGSLLWSYLLSDLSMRDVSTAPNADYVTPAVYPALLSVTAHISELGCSDIDIWVSQNGYLVIDLLGQRYVYAIEASQVQRLAVALVTSGAPYETKVEKLKQTTAGRHRSVADEFETVTVGDIVYTCRTDDYGISADRVGEKLGEMTVENEDRAVHLTYYRLSGVAAHCGLAVRFDGSNCYYSYVNTAYRPDTLGDLLRDLNLRELMSFDDVTVRYTTVTVTQSVTFTDPDEDILWENLFSDPDAVNLSDPDDPAPAVRAYNSMIHTETYAPTLTYGTESLWVTEDGRLGIEILGNVCVFAVSEAQIQRLLLKLVLSGAAYRGTATDANHNDLSRPLYWKFMTPDQRYGGFEVGEITYLSQKLTVDAAYTGERLGTAVAIGYDEVANTVRSTEAVYHAIRGIHPSIAVAVTFPDESDESSEGETYYLYANRGYAPDTLGDLIADLGLDENLILEPFTAGVDSNARTHAVLQFTASDGETVKTLLLANPSAENLKVSYKQLTIGASIHTTARIPLLSIEDQNLRVGINGYLAIDLFGTDMTFYIGEEAAQALIDYLITDCTDPITVESGQLILRSGETRTDAARRLLDAKFYGG